MPGHEDNDAELLATAAESLSRASIQVGTYLDGLPRPTTLDDTRDLLDLKILAEEIQDVENRLRIVQQRRSRKASVKEISAARRIALARWK